jgi:hypothetical protein
MAAFTCLIGTAYLNPSVWYFRNTQLRGRSFLVIALGTTLASAFWRIWAREHNPDAFRPRGKAWLLEDDPSHHARVLLLGIAIGGGLILAAGGIEAVLAQF